MKTNFVAIAFWIFCLDQIRGRPIGRQPLTGLYPLSGRTSYCTITWSLKALRFGFWLFKTLWNCTGMSAAVLPRCLSNCKTARWSHYIVWLRDFTRFGGKTSYRLMKRGLVVWRLNIWQHTSYPLATAGSPGYTSQGICELMIQMI